MNKEKEFFTYLKFFNEQGVLDDLLRMAIYEYSVTTMDELCEFLKGEMECWNEG